MSISLFFSHLKIIHSAPSSGISLYIYIRKITKYPLLQNIIYNLEKEKVCIIRWVLRLTHNQIWVHHLLGLNDLTQISLHRAIIQSNNQHWSHPLPNPIINYYQSSSSTNRPNFLPSSKPRPKTYKSPDRHYK